MPAYLFLIVKLDFITKLKLRNLFRKLETKVNQELTGNSKIFNISSSCSRMTDEVL